MTKCADCGAAFEPNGRGRPRKFCLDCSPRDPIEATKAWRARNREQIAERRRERDAADRAASMAAGSRAIRERPAVAR